ncbi:hypothetical protein HEAR1293 [Herminiimonas arsenicoxydans]|uniref:Uncharacterized protein n=1 Tax=Herminiimonas arsenicoxydans TaxID=204773 RepID=A4G4M9_HERAR|nr:hypothetical protein HEAR1293 [Herminiimonas arsenicoxydans]
MPVGVCPTNVDQHAVRATRNGAESGLHITSTRLFPALTNLQKPIKKEKFYAVLTSELLKNIHSNNKKQRLFPASCIFNGTLLQNFRAQTK